jgi:hypothetical protein
MCLYRCVIRHKQAKNIALLSVLLFIIGKLKVSTLLDTYILFLSIYFYCNLQLNKMATSKKGDNRVIRNEGHEIIICGHLCKTR